MQTRFNFYPPCSRPDLVDGVKPHTDRSGITILLQDKEVEGLQIVVDGKWYRVPVIPYALVVNLGDQISSGMRGNRPAICACPAGTSIAIHATINIRGTRVFADIPAIELAQEKSFAAFGAKGGDPQLFGNGRPHKRGFP
ncbi:hypothetical protein Q3G72_008225 [Acer saccharum]|nr:hypothetical protein Q3G72_008225 [Acer saccharum]